MILLLQAFPSPSGYDGRGELDYHNGKVGMAFAWSPWVFFGDFDPITGDFTNLNAMELYPPGSFDGMYGIEFSPDAHYAYTSRWYSTGGVDNFFVIDLTGATPVIFDSYFLTPDGGGSITSWARSNRGLNGNLYMVLDGTNQVKA